MILFDEALGILAKKYPKQFAIKQSPYPIVTFFMWGEDDIESWEEGDYDNDQFYDIWTQTQCLTQDDIDQILKFLGWAYEVFWQWGDIDAATDEELVPESGWQFGCYRIGAARQLLLGDRLGWRTPIHLTKIDAARAALVAVVEKGLLPESEQNDYDL
jgi:hypothetical protein